MNRIEEIKEEEKKIKERLDIRLPIQKRGRKKDIIYNPIEINLMLEKSKINS